MSSVITISQPPIVPGDKTYPDAPTAMAFAPMDPDLDPEELDIDVSESSEPEVIESSLTSADAHPTELGVRSEGGSRTATPKRKTHEAARQESLEKLSRNAAPQPGDAPRVAEKDKGDKIVKLSWKRANASAKHHPVTSNPDAVIVLKEEKVRLLVLFLSFSGHALIRAQASTFHDFLRFVYPRYATSHPRKSDARKPTLTCDVVWNARSRGTTWRAS